MLVVIFIDFSTLTTGYYMYTSSALPRRQGDKARLISPTIKATPGKCMTFYYHMFGTAMGTLNVYQKTYGRLSFPIWSTTGSQKSTWLPAQVSLNSASDFQVRSSTVQFNFSSIGGEIMYYMLFSHNKYEPFRKKTNTDPATMFVCK